MHPRKLATLALAFVTGWNARPEFGWEPPHWKAAAGTRPVHTNWRRSRLIGGCREAPGQPDQPDPVRATRSDGDHRWVPHGLLLQPLSRCRATNVRAAE